MDINDLKKQLSGISIPENIENIGINKPSNSLLEKLIKEDSRSKALLKRFYVLYFIISALYFVLFILNPDPELELNDRINGVILFVGIILFAIMARRKYRKIKQIKYDQPTVEFIHQTIRRFSFWSIEMNYTVIIALMIDIVTTRSYIANYPTFTSTYANILIFQLVFVSAMMVSVYFGYRHWKKHKKPLLDESIELLNHSKN